MTAIRKLVAIGVCGIVLGAGMSVFGAAPATARLHHCDKYYDNMEAKEARDYEKGRTSDEEYAKIQAEIAFHRQLWGC